MAALIRSGLESPDTEVNALIGAPSHGDVVERLQVYGTGYPARISEALHEAFPAVVHVLGDGAFHALVQRYITSELFRSYNLNDAGSALPRFLRADRLSRALPFLPDLAQLEWQVTRAFHAHEELPFDATVATGWTLDDWAEATLRFQPSVGVITSAWPIRNIWDCRETPLEAIDLDVRDNAERVLVRRSGDNVTYELLDEAEAHVLEMLLAGRTLGTAIAAHSTRGNDPAVVGAWFARWTSLGLITECVPG